jgi:hypothetical protein
VLKIFIYLTDNSRFMYHVGKMPLRKLGIEGRITLEVISNEPEDEGSRFLQRNKRWIYSGMHVVTSRIVMQLSATGPNLTCHTYRK